ncbi:MAG: A/G-specific adenine glycosylase [Flavobacteriales bacterium]|nr:A/G-specific adenine glycosylase [Flavobacteriales bacterium]MCB9193339.1 A/G-specific adenine glycosylase [Flavobacteriales bacterium]
MSSRSWFTRALGPWYAAHRRDLPWRHTRDPYAIWLSEVILQQTRVDQGLRYYQRFLERFPSVQHLARAREDEVLRLWQGLGYYSRARNLLTAARQVVSDHGGRFPRTHAGLLALKGVGDYTAAAIASIAFDVPEPVVDGNVYRVLARVFGIDTPIDSTAGRRTFRELATTLMPREHPGDHNQAVMELGATICTPNAPDCPNCPLHGKCIARREGRVDRLPVKQGRTKVRDRHLHFGVVRRAGTIWVEKRGLRDIWAGLYVPPLLESEADLDANTFLKHWRVVHRRSGWRVKERIGPVRHLLSHQRLHITFWELVPPKGARPPAGIHAVTRVELEQLALPRPIERYFQ